MSKGLKFYSLNIRKILESCLGIFCEGVIIYIFLNISGV